MQCKVSYIIFSFFLGNISWIPFKVTDIQVFTIKLFDWSLIEIVLIKEKNNPLIAKTLALVVQFF